MERKRVTIENSLHQQQEFGIDEYEDHVVLSACLSDDVAVLDIPFVIEGKPITAIGGDCFFAHKEITAVSFLGTLKSIGMQAFGMCKGIRELILPDSITEIESYAFRDCTGLRKIVLPAALRTLKYGVFAFCYLPEDVEIILNEGLEAIESRVFGELNLFSTVKIPNSVKKCAPDAFEPRVTVIFDELSDCALTFHIEKSYSFLRDVCERYRNGYMTDNERYNLFAREFQKGFYDYLSSKKVSTNFNDDSWCRFLEDYGLWRDGKQPCSLLGSAWLICDDSEEAGVLDKNSFFKLMEAYRISPSYFQPIPDSCAKPQHDFNMYGTGMAGRVRFDLSDDGGMYSCGNPIGKEFILTDENGLKAVVFIERAGKNDEIHNHMDSQYVGHGTIEGYTSSREREIFISERKNNTVWFWISVDNDDLDVLQTFPLLDSYNAFQADWWKRRREHMQGLINHFDETIA